MKKTARNRRIPKSDWLVTAFEALEAGGVEAVRVDVLAKRLGISRSGFYWHFEDRSDLLQQMLQYWQEEFTNVVLRNIRAVGGTPEERLVRTSEMIKRYSLTQYDLSIRNWARYDPLARSAVAHVNKIRLDFVRSIFSDMGFKDDELEMRTMLYVCYESFEKPMFFNVSASKLKKLAKLRVKLLSKK